MRTRAAAYVVAAVLGLAASGVLADTLIFASNDANGVRTSDPPYRENSGTWTYFGIHSAVSPGKGARTSTSSTAQFQITPSLGQSGGTYSFDISHGDASGVTADIVMNLSVTGGSLVDTDDNPVTSTTAFRRPGANDWERVGTLKLNPGVTVPVIVFTAVGGYTNRLYVDAFRFTSEQTCTSGLPVLDPPKGPLIVGQTQVIVQGVDATATKVSVYAKVAGSPQLVGELTSGIVAGDNVLSVTPAALGSEILATQWNAAGVQSCMPNAGSLVGTGPNSEPLQVVLNIRKTPFANGPIGSDGSGMDGDLFFLGSAAARNGAGSAPASGQIVSPGRCWQTVAFDRAISPTYNWTGIDGPVLEGKFGVLDGIGITIPATAPSSLWYVVYIDNVMNGDTLIQDFEAGTGAMMFSPPSAAAITRPFLLPSSGELAPDVAQVTAENADTGSKSLKVSWQFKDGSTNNWLLLKTLGSETPNPVVDLRRPISLRMLVLPIGESTEAGPTILDAPDSVIAQSGNDAVFTVQATGTGTLHYVWLLNGSPEWIRNGFGGGAPDSPTLTLTGLTRADDGTHVSVSICDESGSTLSADAVLSVPCPAPFADADRDHDVDQDDFAVFQLCFTGTGYEVVPGDCTCFDRDAGGPDGDVDVADAEQFARCITGAAIPWSHEAYPGCPQ